MQVSNLKGIYGDCSVSEKKIRIHQTQSVEAAKHTLWHEAIHAALGLSGITELLDDKNVNLEEAVVRCIEHAFSDVVNLDLLAHISNENNHLTNEAE